MHNVLIEKLDVTLDKLCENHLILRRWICTCQGITHVVKHYRCNRGVKIRASTKSKVKSCTNSISHERREMTNRRLKRRNGYYIVTYKA